MDAMIRAQAVDLDDTVSAAADGDHVAFARIVATYHADMLRVCAFVTRDDGMAEDAVQAAWVIAWRKLRSLREPVRIRPWLVRIAVNEAKQLLRGQVRRTRSERIADISGMGTGGIDPATGIDSLDVLAALDRLDPADRALLAMRYVLGFDATDLGAAIGLSPSGTRARLARVLARLRKDLT
jgi:RNA polymerase sigma-70 factor (ECF subfamily)